MRGAVNELYLLVVVGTVRNNRMTVNKPIPGSFILLQPRRVHNRLNAFKIGTSDTSKGE
jgi:hypothetical protein